MYAEWSKCWPRAKVTEEEREAGVADADKAIIELKVNHYWISQIIHITYMSSKENQNLV
jgi:hypothetical protein